MVEVKQSNPKAFEELDLKLKELQGYEGRVGWGEDAKYDDDENTPVAYVAAIQELGHGPIPPRPFMRPSSENNKAALTAVATHASNQVLDGKITGQDAMGLICARSEGDVAQAIADVNNPSLSPITLWARYYRRQGKKVTGATIGEIAGKIASGEYDAGGPPGVSKKPLNDTGRMISTLESRVTSV